VRGSVGGEDNHGVHAGICLLYCRIVLYRCMGARQRRAVSACVAWLHAEDMGLLGISGGIHSDLGVRTPVQEELLGPPCHGLVRRAVRVYALLIVAALLIVRGHEHVVVRIGFGLLVSIVVFGGRHLESFQASGLAEAVQGSQALWCPVAGACEILRGTDSLH